MISTWQNFELSGVYSFYTRASICILSFFFLSLSPLSLPTSTFSFLLFVSSRRLSVMECERDAPRQKILTVLNHQNNKNVDSFGHKAQLISTKILSSCVENSRLFFSFLLLYNGHWILYSASPFSGRLRTENLLWNNLIKLKGNWEARLKYLKTFIYVTAQGWKM